MSPLKELNHYLFVEFGLDEQEENRVADDWPFVLREVGNVGDETVYEFTDPDGERFYGISGQALNFMPISGMSLEDLARQNRGAAWIGARDPISLAESRLGDDSVPPTIERREELATLAATASSVATVAEGLFLKRASAYLALALHRDSKAAWVVGLAADPISVGFPNASAWRRLAWGVGAWLDASE